MIRCCSPAMTLRPACAASRFSAAVAAVAGPQRSRTTGARPNLLGCHGAEPVEPGGEANLELGTCSEQLPGGDEPAAAASARAGENEHAAAGNVPPSSTRASSARPRPAYSVIRSSEIPISSTTSRSTSRICRTLSHGSDSAVRDADQRILAMVLAGSGVADIPPENHGGANRSVTGRV
jgi:hypothetical protein